MSVTQRRRVTIAFLKRKGFPVVQGTDYIPSSCLPKKAPSLADVRRRLAKIKGDLSNTVSQIRDEE